MRKAALERSTRRISSYKGWLLLNLILICILLALQVHEMAMVSAVQEAQKDNLRSFNDYMIKVLEVSNLCFVFPIFLLLLSISSLYFFTYKWQEWTKCFRLKS